MALQLSHTTCEVAEFVGYWSQVSDLDLTSFLLQTCKRCAFTRPITMEFFSTGEAIEHVGRLCTDDERLWPVLALSQLAGKKKWPNDFIQSMTRFGLSSKSCDKLIM